jgi:hypothetical protein
MAENPTAPAAADTMVTPLNAQDQIQPPAPSPGQPDAQAGAAGGKGGLPEEVLKMPAMQALMAGSPPAVSLPLKDFSKRDAAAPLVKAAPALQKAGFGFYRSMSGNIGVIFNQLYIHPADVQAADKMGKLQAIAPPWDVLDHTVGKSGPLNPVLARTSVPGGPAAPRAVAPPQSGNSAIGGSGPGGNTLPVPLKAPSAGVARKLTTARILNLNQGAPTTGPEPGQGRLVNQILKPVV